MCSHEPGSFTKIIAAMVIPRKTSSETTRVIRVISVADEALETGAAMVCAVAMGCSSAGGDSTAVEDRPQWLRELVGRPRSPLHFFFVGQGFSPDIKPAK